MSLSPRGTCGCHHSLQSFASLHPPPLACSLPISGFCTRALGLPAKGCARATCLNRHAAILGVARTASQLRLFPCNLVLSLQLLKILLTVCWYNLLAQTMSRSLGCLKPHSLHMMWFLKLIFFRYCLSLGMHVFAALAPLAVLVVFTLANHVRRQR